MKGRKFLKVTGILMIIGGAFGIIGGIVAMFGAGALAAAFWHMLLLYSGLTLTKE